MNETAGRRELEGLVARVADEFIERQQKGERPDPAEYATRHPEAASTLGRVLGMLQFVGPVIPDPETDSYQPRQDGPAVEGTLGDFRIVREVGRGGMGVVYEAEQLSLRRRVALKVLPFAATLDPRRLKRFHNEAVAAASLHHENIVPVFAVGCERGVHFYAMQLIDGCSVEKILNAKKAENEPGDVDGTPTLERERGASYHREVARLGVVTAEAARSTPTRWAWSTGT
ncbi:MAG: protein kinase [Gemmataceae bacterium]